MGMATAVNGNRREISMKIKVMIMIK